MLLNTLQIYKNMTSIDYYACDKFLLSFAVSVTGVPQVVILWLLEVRRIVP